MYPLCRGFILPKQGVDMRNMLKIRLLAMLLLSTSVGCSTEDNVVKPEPNKPPTLSFTFARLAVARSTDVTLTVNVSDPDGDPVTVTWAVTRGLLNPADQGTPTMRWSTPATVGSDSITVTASDGKGGQKTIRPTVDVATPWVGNVAATVSWVAASSPYLLTPSAGADRVTIVAPGGRLTIGAGVVVYVNQAGMSLNVEQELTVAGTPIAPVTLKPNARTPAPGYWSGILGVGTSVIDLENAVLPHAESAVRAIENAEVFLTDCKIMFSSEAAVLHESRGALLVEDCSITNNLKNGILVKLLTSTPSAVTIRGDSIAVNGRFEDVTDYPDGEAGITLAFSDPSGMVPIDISDNEISRNDFPGIRLLATVFPTITNNGIFGNELRKASGKINIELVSPYGNGAINATLNWWGQAYPQSSDSLAIKQGIYDADDNLQIGTRVSVTPWKPVWP